MITNGAGLAGSLTQPDTDAALWSCDSNGETNSVRVSVYVCAD